MEGKNYINGKWYQASYPANPQKTFPKINPVTEEIIGHFPETNQKTVWDAVAAARKAQKSWRQLSRVKRAEYFENLIGVLNSFRTEITNTICLETGKNFNEANAEFNEAVHMAQYTFAQAREPYGTFVASEIADKDITVFRKPKGVVAVIAPWNFPFAIGGFWTSAPAILEGNTVVFKPSEDAPLTGQLIAQLYQCAGFPEGVFNLIHGHGGTGDSLVQAQVDHICFTGSVDVGRLIRRKCAESVYPKSCSCEMGSKSAVVVFADTPSDMAVNACVSSAFKLAGQRCVSSGRMLVQRNIYDDFCERFVDAAKKLKIGSPFVEATQPQKNAFDFNPYDQSVFYGPLINKSQFERVQHFNDKTKGKTDILLEGTRLGDKGYFLSPHVYACSWDHAHTRDENHVITHPFLRQEVFGPHVAIIPFDDAEDAVRIYNDTDYGLSMAVLTTNMSVARYMRDNCEYGLGYHNLPSIGAESHIPFGGVKGSGYGGSSAAGTFKAVTHEVTWTANFDPNGFTFCQGMK